MQPAQDDDSKDGRYFPSDSEMPILIHYLQIYFSHPERSIQRSQVVQNVASILSPTNKHWNHRTIRLWFNNNKRVFYRPTSPQQIQTSNEQTSSSISSSFSQELESTNQALFNSPPIPKYYLPARSLSVVQIPTVVDSTQDQRIPQFTAQNMNASQWERLQQQQLQQTQTIIQPKRGSFALHLVDVRDHLVENQFDPQIQRESEIRTTEKLISIHDQKWNQITPIHPCKSTIIDTSSIPVCQNNTNRFSFQMASPSSSTFSNQIPPSSSTPPSPPSMPGPIPVTSHISNPNSPSSSYSSSPSPTPSSPLSNTLSPSLSLSLSTYPNSPGNGSSQPAPYPVRVCAYDLIEASTFTDNGIPLIVSYDLVDQADQIHLNLNSTSNSEDIVCRTEFLSSTSSIAYDDEASHLWIHSETFVRSFYCNSNENNFQIDQTLLTGPHHSLRSAMTFWDKNLVLSSNSTILTWKPDIMYPRFDMHENNEEIIENFGVCLTLIVPNIDALTTVDDYLVVASSDYHTAHIIATNGACANRSIGHTAGITALHKYDSNSFITGSADQTAKYWDIRVPVAVHSMHRHKGIVTSVFGNGNDNSNLIFTGGTDGIIRSWDIREMRTVFSIDIGEATPQTIYFNNKTKILKAITSEKCKDYFYDLGRFSYQNTKIADFGLNSILSFQCVNE